jgi:hypothetical protein
MFTILTGLILGIVIAVAIVYLFDKVVMGW